MTDIDKQIQYELEYGSKAMDGIIILTIIVAVVAYVIYGISTTSREDKEAMWNEVNNGTFEQSDKS